MMSMKHGDISILNIKDSDYRCANSTATLTSLAKLVDPNKAGLVEGSFFLGVEIFRKDVF